jgi:hypothetical protein
MVTLFAQPAGRALIKKHCRAIGLPEADLKSLLEEVIEKDTMLRRNGLWQAFDAILDSAGKAEG